MEFAERVRLSGTKLSANAAAMLLFHSRLFKKKDYKTRLQTYTVTQRLTPSAQRIHEEEEDEEEEGDGARGATANAAVRLLAVPGDD